MASRESLAVRKVLLDQAAARSAELPSLEELRQGSEAMFGQFPVDPEAGIGRLTIEDIPAEWVTGPTAVDDRVLLYLHGGGYCYGSCSTRRDLAARLSRSGCVRVLVPEFRLAPEHCFPAAVDDAVRVYRWLISSGFAPERIVVGGDSAGGGLAVALLVSLRDAGDPLPAAAVLLSPWTDLECTGESIVTRAEFDPLIKPETLRTMALLYIRDGDVRHPLVSPIYADLHKLPPMLVHVGRDECLLGFAHWKIHQSGTLRSVERGPVDGLFFFALDQWVPPCHGQSVSPDRTYLVRKQNMPRVPWRAWFSASGCGQGLISLVLVAVVQCAFNRRVLTPSVMSDSFPSRPWAPAYRCRPTEGLADLVGSQRKKGNGRICRNNRRVLMDK